MKKLLIVTLSALALCCINGLATAASITISAPTDDVYVHSSRPDINFNHSNAGENTQLGVKSYLSSYRGLLKFDLSEIPDSAVITGATLHLYALPTSDDTIYFSRMGNDLWDEDTVTWNSYESSFSDIQLMGHQSIQQFGYDPSWKDISLSLENWSQGVDLFDDTLTLMLDAGPLTYSYSTGAIFASKEYLDPGGIHYQPSLTLEYATVPVPAAAWLFGSVVFGLVGVRRKRQ